MNRLTTLVKQQCDDKFVDMHRELMLQRIHRVMGDRSLTQDQVLNHPDFILIGESWDTLMKEEGYVTD